jgi:hypothetical protein
VAESIDVSEFDLSLKDLINYVRGELEGLGAQLVADDRTPLFALEEFEVELHFGVTHRRDAKAGIDLKIFSIEGGGGADDETVQTVRLKYSVDPAQNGKPGTRAHSSQPRTSSESVLPLSDD